MARIIDENFEGTGYEETWAETIDAGCTLDEDSVLPGSAPYPVGAGSQCLKAIVLDATYADAYALQTKTNQNISYIRGYVYLSEEGLADNQYFYSFVLADGASAVVSRIQIAQISGVLNVRFSYYSNSAIQNTAFTNISLNTWYRIEYKYDITNLLWEWRINGVLRNSGSLVANTRTPQKLLIGIQFNIGVAQSTLYTDLVVWDDAAWVGGELSIPIARRRGR
ncbi:MAG TPA: hypothetical protein ENH85_08185 [Candidatus Scalindua sp.]|nr:hypothetical protein [Candidatus Scalindua sp.]